MPRVLACCLGAVVFDENDQALEDALNQSNPKA